MDRRSNAGRNVRLREAADRSIDQGRRLDRTSMVAGAYTALALPHLAVGVTAAIEPVPQPREQDHYR